MEGGGAPDASPVGWEMGSLQQACVCLGVEGAVGAQTAEDHAVDAEFTAGADVVDHALQLELRVEEVAASRTDDDMQACGLQSSARTLVEQVPCLVDLAIGWRGATLGDAGAELHAVGTALLCSNATLHAVGADFEAIAP